MDWQRYTLLGGIAAVVLALIYQWNDFQERRAPIPDRETVVREELPTSSPATQTRADNDVPQLEAQSDTAAGKSDAQRKLISVTTDVFDLLIDPRGGDIVKVALRRYEEELHTPDRPLILLNQTRDHTYIAQSGLIGQNGTDSAAGRPLFTVAETKYALKEGQDTLTVDLTLNQGETDITKRFTFHRGDYLIDVTYLVDNRSSEAWSAAMFGQIKRDDQEPPVDVGIGVSPFLGAAMHTTEENYFKQDFEDIAEKPTRETVEGGWVAMVQHYFLSAWIPPQDERNTFELRQLSGGLYRMGFTSPPVAIAPGNQGTLSAAFYAGPKDVYRLEEISPYLDLTVDYGWLWWIAKPLFGVLHFIQSHIASNWGWAIILLTVFIKALLFPLSAAGTKSMARMRKFAPQMKKLQEQYKDNRQKLAEETMKLYRREKINPMGGCLPIMLQMPVFIALYWMLTETVELRHAPWIFWIHDLSAKDPYFILPALMGLSMWFMQKLNPQPTDPTQARIMQLMPVMMTFFFLWFPAGLVLYWIANNLITIAQTWYINKQVDAGKV
ncbi:membrane protein insertase YidC [Microbulbifer thermotolerans]|uniref:membrane protein insertase YidC n=1 Tax=Microbulbifer thermotolerans TaxID=252514 RepID=UPI0008EF5095|nr:membrane protein insertase YidC [Microbulbifer thermotolerans]MCX2778516.1 membrane protein insertase YidC [Microbulbifer thermotolerans]MCX2803975.1 membrane protein insertase YidC [Microbulbifer thermotolerans]WKT60612.1 membrane protein insertase YidC [Microbulbifer thermotolerans]SFC18284.1 YidC/Oxa1 family membrane protein insertase [Microbulbifer thermotolerans]